MKYTVTFYFVALDHQSVKTARCFTFAKYIKPMSNKIDEDELERQAVAEIMQEAKRGAERAKEMGSLGWVKPQISTNKNFLRNTLVSTLRHPYGTKKKNDFQPKYSPHKHHKYHDKHSQNYHSGSYKGKQKGGWTDTTACEDDPKLQEDGAIDQRLKPPEGGYVYDAYEYSFQAPKEVQGKQKYRKKDEQSKPRKASKSSLDKQNFKRTKHADEHVFDSSWSESSFSEDGEKYKEDGAIDQRLKPPEEGYIYDAYDYSYQASKETQKKGKDSDQGYNHLDKKKPRSRTKNESAREKHSEKHRKRRHSRDSEDSRNKHKKKHKSKKKHKHKKRQKNMR